jgi:hypothetical protein
VRALVGVGILLLAATRAGAAAPDDDDPKEYRGELGAPAAPTTLAAEDDPKLARGASVSRRVWKNTHPVPRFKLAYRRLSTHGLENDTIDFNVVEIDYYPSSHYFRFGVDTEVGIGSDKYSSWFFTVGGAVGLQYPWRVTPFVDARFIAGLVGGSFMGQSAVSWIYMGGIEGGIEAYVAGRFYVTAAIGWAHPVFSGIDVQYVREHPTLAPARKDFANDTFTFKVGLGL